MVTRCLAKTLQTCVSETIFSIHMTTLNTSFVKFALRYMVYKISFKFNFNELRAYGIYLEKESLLNVLDVQQIWNLLFFKVQHMVGK
jgi:hypothetical protein